MFLIVVFYCIRVSYSGVLLYRGFLIVVFYCIVVSCSGVLLCRGFLIVVFYCIVVSCSGVLLYRVGGLGFGGLGVWGFGGLGVWGLGLGYMLSKCKLVKCFFVCIVYGLAQSILAWFVTSCVTNVLQ